MQINSVGMNNRTNFGSIILPKGVDVLKLAKKSSYNYKGVTIQDKTSVIKATRNYINDPIGNKLRKEMGDPIPDVAILSKFDPSKSDVLVGKSVAVEKQLFLDEILPKYPGAAWFLDF